MAAVTRRAAIARLNDRFRFTGIGGQILLTVGVAGLPEGELHEILGAVRCFDSFTPDNARPAGMLSLQSTVGETVRISIDHHVLQAAGQRPLLIIEKK